MTWTDERVERARKLWQDGWSATRIAGELGGGITRNAVLSKIHRSGFATRPETATPTVAPRSKFDPRTRAAAPRPAPAPRQSVPALARPPIADGFNIPPDATPCTLIDLREGMCKWPLGDPREESFRFCGAQSTFRADGNPSPYCSGHHAMAYSITPKPSRMSDDGKDRVRQALLQRHANERRAAL